MAGTATQKVRSLAGSNTSILTIAAGDAATPAPTLPATGGWVTNSSGILHLEMRDDDPGGPNAWTTAEFCLWYLEDQLSNVWKQGAAFTWDFRTGTGTTGSQTITLNIQGKSRVFVQMLSKAVAAGASTVWAGINTIEGA